MARLFRDWPKAIAQTIYFLNRCNFSLDEVRKTEYPDEKRQGFATPQDALVAFVKDGVQLALSERHEIRHSSSISTKNSLSLPNSNMRPIS